MNGWLNPGQPGTTEKGATEKGVMQTSVVNPVEKVLLANSEPSRMSSGSLDPTTVANRGVFMSHNGRVNIGYVDGHFESLGPKEVDFLRDHYSHAFDTSQP